MRALNSRACAGEPDRCIMAGMDCFLRNILRCWSVDDCCNCCLGVAVGGAGELSINKVQEKNVSFFIDNFLFSFFATLKLSYFLSN